jgi:hypothetical protein
MRIQRWGEMGDRGDGCPESSRLMDKVGLDVVLAIEQHYSAVRKDVLEGLRTQRSPANRASMPERRGLFPDSKTPFAIAPCVAFPVGSV